MTTSTDSGGTLPGIIEAERPIDVLLKESATTYQHMTDEEIARVVEYRCEVERRRAFEEDRYAKLQERAEAAKAAVEARAEQSRAQFEELLGMRASFVTVDPETGLAVRND